MNRAAGQVLCLTLLAAAFVAAARWTIGPTIHCGFLPLFVAPVLAAYLPRLRIGSIAMIAVAATVPLLGIGRFADWLQVALLTTAASATVGAIVLPLPVREETRSDEAASIRQTLVLLAWIAWLTWPIWLASAWPNPHVGPWLDRLLPLNPIAAVGGVLLDLGDWTHLPIAYKYLVNLGQDVPYEPPASAWPAIFAHAAAAATIFAVRRRIARRPAHEAA